MEDCIFCKIIAGEIPCHKVFENDQVLAFMDINPIHEGHLLVLPKKHHETIFDMDEELSLEVMRVTRLLANRLKEEFKIEGLHLIQNNYKAASQEVPHFHMHLIPRHTGDGIQAFKWKLVEGDHEKLAQQAEQLKI